MVTTDGMPPQQAALLARVKGILLSPRAEWQKIEPEPTTAADLYRNYVLLLAAVPVLCGFVGSLLFGIGGFGVTVRPSFGTALTTAILSYALALGGVFVLALIVDFLAPTFQAERNQRQALKLVAYAATAGWLAGVFALLPGLGILQILGLYSLYLLYTGLPIMMKAPADKALPYTAVVIVVGAVLGLILAAVFGTTGIGTRMAGSGGEQTMSGEVTLPGGTKVDLSQLEKAAKSMEEAAKRIEQQTAGVAGGGTAGGGTTGGGTTGEGEGAVGGEAGGDGTIAPDLLKTALPETLPGGFTRAEVSTASGSVAGLGGSSATADYVKDEARVTLSITDMGVMGALAALGGSLGVQGSEETATTYSRVGRDKGRMTIEEYDREAQSGHYSVMVTDRVMVEARGTGVSMDALKASVEAVGLDKVETLVRNGG